MPFVVGRRHDTMPEIGVVEYVPTDCAERWIIAGSVLRWKIPMPLQRRVEGPVPTEPRAHFARHRTPPVRSGIQFSDSRAMPLVSTEDSRASKTPPSNERRSSAKRQPREQLVQLLR